VAGELHNPKTIKDVFPLPLVDECLDTLAGNVWYSKLDANSAYWQVKIKPEDCSKTAFITKWITPALNIFFNWASSSPANPNGVRLILCLTGRLANWMPIQHIGR
jgi:hypothetical protein